MTDPAQHRQTCAIDGCPAPVAPQAGVGPRPWASAPRAGQPRPKQRNGSRTPTRAGAAMPTTPPDQSLARRSALAASTKARSFLTYASLGRRPSTKLKAEHLRRREVGGRGLLGKPGSEHPDLGQRGVYRGVRRDGLVTILPETSGDQALTAGRVPSKNLPGLGLPPVALTNPVLTIPALTFKAPGMAEADEGDDHAGHQAAADLDQRGEDLASIVVLSRSVA